MSFLLFGSAIIYVFEGFFPWLLPFFNSEEYRTVLMKAQDTNEVSGNLIVANQFRLYVIEKLQICPPVKSHLLSS